MPPEFLVIAESELQILLPHIGQQFCPQMVCIFKFIVQGLGGAPQLRRNVAHRQGVVPFCTDHLSGGAQDILLVHLFGTRHNALLFTFL